MKKLALGIVVALLALAIAIPASAQAGPGITTATYTGGSDYCQNPSIAKSNAIVSVGAAATGELVAAVAGKTIYVCSFDSTFAGAVTTLTFKTGTKVTNPCDTNPAAVSGVFALAAGPGTFNLGGSGGVLFKSAVSGEICLTTVGAASASAGQLRYVQR